MTTYLVTDLLYMSIMSITGRIDLYDERAEGILPRDGYQGRGTGGEGIAGKLRAVTCYMLEKLGKDHNSFFADVKPSCLCLLQYPLIVPGEALCLLFSFFPVSANAF